MTAPKTVDLSALFSQVKAGTVVSEATVTSAESAVGKASIVASFAIYLRITGTDSNPGRYSTATGRQLAYVQRSFRIGSDIARIGDKVTAAQASASSWLRNSKGTESVKAFDALMVRANDGEPVVPAIDGPAYGRLLTTALALAQADAAAVKAEQASKGTEPGEAEQGEQPEQVERTDEQRVSDALKVIRPVLKRASEGDTDALEHIARLGKAVQIAFTRGTKVAERAAATEQPTDESEVEQVA